MGALIGRFKEAFYPRSTLFGGKPALLGHGSYTVIFCEAHRYTVPSEKRGGEEGRKNRMIAAYFYLNIFVNGILQRRGRNDYLTAVVA